MELLLLPSIFVFIIYLTKFIQESIKSGAGFPLESIVGTIFSLLISLYVFNAKFKSSASINLLNYGHDYSSIIKITNSSESEVNVDLIVITKDKNNEFKNFVKIPPKRLLDVSNQIRSYMAEHTIDGATYLELKFNAPSKYTSIEAKTYSKATKVNENVDLKQQ